ncbi:hypothetical protein TTHERM_00809360 (macronuclear) [Tetrahymena thermophila SB210]|uniref:Uncharacterized protein n=1 Tax=Tetrahymena thermophila (strain SB210) TaxID=312017 RepID=Q233N8_TETTS|nr:hypothetical protein TTHERM_00809360 [Tetrahymena thermophila SB210]EAR91791.1 hypothetical protein TTHERM_00809360 [Tetrahymena thermophila SB210]|eukprot:XP_001012036.1 hypothetical protein TTHERM_00809360 [Tetrahymena thermophila SB210]
MQQQTKGKNEEINLSTCTQNAFYIYASIRHYENIKKQKKLACEQDLDVKNFAHLFFKTKANQVKKKADKCCEDLESLPNLNVFRMCSNCYAKFLSLFTKRFYCINLMISLPIIDENSDQTTQLAINSQIFQENFELIQLV